MKLFEKILLLQVFLVIDIYASQNDCWKVTFFNKYMEEYKKQSPTDHAGFSSIVAYSWQKAVDLVPDPEKERAKRVAEQVQFFTTIADPKVQEEEAQKCIEGMKQAGSFAAYFVTIAYKAEQFVARFEDEHKQRRVSQ